MKVPLRFLWQRCPALSTGTWKQTPEVLAGRGTAAGTFHPAFAPLSFHFFLRPSVIGALFGEINCCVVNGLDRTSRPVAGLRRGVVAVWPVTTGLRAATARLCLKSLRPGSTCIPASPSSCPSSRCGEPSSGAKGARRCAGQDKTRQDL